jgi:galactose mutarotase-like enzyme
MTIPLTGQQYQIGAGRYRATVTELGAGLRELLFDDQPVIAGYEPDELPPGGAGQLLAPWPNRIDGGDTVLLRSVPYGQRGYPFCLEIDAEYRLAGDSGLHVAITATNRDGRAWAQLAADGGAGTRVGLWAGQGYPWMQAFTGDTLGPDRRRTAVAIEAMTCPPNAFVTAHDLLVLQPGDSVTHTWGIQVLSD